MALTIAVAVHALAVTFPDLHRNFPVLLTAGGDAVNFEQFQLRRGRGNFARIQLIARIEGGFQSLQLRVEFAEKFRRVFGAHALAVFAPEQAFVFFDQLNHLVGDRADQGFLFRIFHVDGGAHVEYSRVHMAEHAVGHASLIQYLTELHDEVGQVFRRHSGIFHEGNGTGFTFGIAQQAHGFFAHGPDFCDRRRTPCEAVTQAAFTDIGVGIQLIGQRFDRGFQFFLAVGGVLHQVDALNRLAALRWRKELGHAVPDDVVHRQIEHLRVHGFDGGGFGFHQLGGIAQRRVKVPVVNIHQRGDLGDGQQVELGLGDKAQGAFAAAQHAVQIKATFGCAHMGKIVAGQAAIELGKFGVDQLGVVGVNLIECLVYLAHAILALADLGQLGVVHGAGGPVAAVEQYGAQLQHVVPGFAVAAGALAGGVGVDHAADGGPVAGGQIRGEEQSVGLEGRVQLVFHHAALDPRPALLDVDFEDLVHVFGGVHHQSVGEGLAIGAGAAAAGAQDDVLIIGLVAEPGQDHQVVHVFGVDDALGQDLVDGVVGRQHGAVGVVRVQIALKVGLAQGLNKREVAALDGGGVAYARYHLGRYSSRQWVQYSTGLGWVSPMCVSYYRRFACDAPAGYTGVRHAVNTSM